MEYSLSAKKIKLIRKTYETYCEVKTLQATRQATGLGINTIRKYIVIAEQINNKNKLSTKDRYYTPDPEIITPEVIPSPEPPIYNIIYNKDNINKSLNNNIYSKDNKDLILDNKEYKENNIYNKDINKDNTLNIIENNLENKSLNNINNIENIDKDIITDTINIKEKLILNKLNNISNKYLDYLNNIDLYSMDKVSIKDIGIIAGISLDKAAQLKHKDVVKTNQSIIFNLFGNNKSLTEFIAGSIGRQERLSSRPVKKYIPALNK